MFAAERHCKQKEILDAIESGVIVLIDRYVFSGIAYGCASGVGRLFCYDINNGLVKPDLTILLDSSPDLFVERKFDLHEQPENVGFQRDVIEEYKNLADDDWLVLDASDSVQDIKKKIFTRALQTIRSLEDLTSYQRLSNAHLR